jgi:hypothetical protein
MKEILARVLLILSLPILQAAQEGEPTIVLPNPKLLTCRGTDCSKLWSTESTNNPVFPKQVILDTEQGCIYGMTAMYEKTVSFDELKGAIDEQYGKWALPGFDKSHTRLWRIEPEKYAIHLAVLDKRDEKRGVAEAGTKEVIFLAIGGRSACAH